MTAPGAYPVRLRIGTTLVALLSAMACSADPAARELDVQRTDSAGVELTVVSGLDVDRLPAWSLASRPTVEIGTSAGTAGQDLHWARAAARAADGRVLVANQGSNEIRLFDETGGFVRAYGRRGRGPGEFEQLAWAGWAGGDTILGYDPSHRRLTAFTVAGDVAYSRTLPLPDTPSFPEVVAVLANGRILAYPGFDRVFGRGERRDTVAYMLYAADATHADTLGRYPGTERFFAAIEGGGAMQMDVLLGRAAHAAAKNDRVVVGSSDALELDEFDADGVLRRRTRIDMPARPVSQREERELREHEQARRQQGLEAMPAPIRTAVEQGVRDVPMRSTYPAFTALWLDADDHVWLRLPSAPGVAAADWLVLDRQAVPVARVTAPADLDVLEVGTDYVLTRQRDAQGVERIEVYPLRRGGEAEPERGS